MTTVAIVTVSAKGQIQIPKKMRDALDIREGSRLWVEMKNGKLEMVKLESRAMDSDSAAMLVTRTKTKKSAETEETKGMMRISEEVLKKDWDYKGDDIWDDL